MGRCVILRLSWKTPAASIYVFSRKFLAPAGKKKKNFNHRLGACYNLGIYIYMLKVFLLLFVLPPHSCSVLWNNSALMRRFAW